MKKQWYQKKVKLLEVDNIICHLLAEFANTPLDKRESGWQWLLKVRDYLKHL